MFRLPQTGYTSLNLVNLDKLSYSMIQQQVFFNSRAALPVCVYKCWTLRIKTRQNFPINALIIRFEFRWFLSDLDIENNVHYLPTNTRLTRFSIENLGFLQKRKEVKDSFKANSTGGRVFIGNLKKVIWISLKIPVQSNLDWNDYLRVYFQ